MQSGDDDQGPDQRLDHGFLCEIGLGDARKLGAPVGDHGQLLIDTGTCWTLQGRIGRTAANLIEQGVCSPAGGKT